MDQPTAGVPLLELNIPETRLMLSALGHYRYALSASNGGKGCAIKEFSEIEAALVNHLRNAAMSREESRMARDMRVVEATVDGLNRALGSGAANEMPSNEEILADFRADLVHMVANSPNLTDEAFWERAGDLFERALADRRHWFRRREQA